MQNYTITITNDENKNETRTFTVTAEYIDLLANNLEKTANYSDELQLELVDGTYLSITQDDEHGYHANLYANECHYINMFDPIGGGLCTGTLKDAIDMAIYERN